MVSKKTQEKIKKAILVNKDRVMLEIMETKGLYDLLVKWSTQGSVSENEMVFIKKQLLDILKSIPALAIFLVPFGSILLFLLIKILPFDILPSSFSEPEEKLLDDPSDI